MPFSYSGFVEKMRVAASSQTPTISVREELVSTLASEELQKSGLPEQHEDEILLFEDDTVSIWSCRFNPEFVMPPHEHKMEVHIGVVSGQEKNIMFEQNDGVLKHVKTAIVDSGEILSIDADALHAVTAIGDTHSHALHVYLGPLTKVKRDLYDWTTGSAVDFTMENFEDMKRSPKDLPAF
ncbi:hypothetical protein [Lentilitoribacter sp. EG35]|uniref:hypothetical protein n=1 Tax=Lentilitoribacter sp. EG35 TaxID=3234192 RepID=UPI0034612F6D